MPLRSLPFPASLTQANEIIHFYFVRLDVASPVGTQRFTDMPGGFVGNIDGSGSQTWNESGVVVGPLNQSDQDPMKVSWVRFWNLDGQFTTWANSPGLRNAPVYVYDAWFNIVNNAPGSLAGSLLLYYGTIDNQEILDEATLAVKPFSTPWAKEVPWVTAKNLGAAALLPAQNTNIEWGNTITKAPAPSLGKQYIPTYPDEKRRIVIHH